MVLYKMFKKAKIAKLITFLIFAAAIIFLVLLTKNKGDFAAVFADIFGIFK